MKAERTDRDREYINLKMQTEFKDKGVDHNTTVPYTPEQNVEAGHTNGESDSDAM